MEIPDSATPLPEAEYDFTIVKVEYRHVSSVGPMFAVTGHTTDREFRGIFPLEWTGAVAALERIGANLSGSPTDALKSLTGKVLRADLAVNANGSQRIMYDSVQLVAQAQTAVPDLTPSLPSEEQELILRRDGRRYSELPIATFPRNPTGNDRKKILEEADLPDGQYYVGGGKGLSRVWTPFVITDGKVHRA